MVIVMIYLLSDAQSARAAEDLCAMARLGPGDVVCSKRMLWRTPVRLRISHNAEQHQQYMTRKSSVRCPDLLCPRCMHNSTSVATTFIRSQGYLAATARPVDPQRPHLWRPTE